MGRLSAPLLAFALAAVAALGLTACGDSGSADLLPGGTASEITANLDQVKELATAGDCVGAEDAAQAVSTQIEELGGVDEKLKQALREGATRLNEVVAGCEEVETEETLPAVEPAEELEEAEPKEKPVKPEKPKKEVEEAEETTPVQPTPAKGEDKAESGGEEEAAPVEPSAGTPSGGVGPGTPAGSE